MADFSGYTFEGDADFGGFVFPGDTGFTEAAFSGDAGFQRAKFSGDARFSGVKFSGNAGFNETEFSDDAGFQRAKFSGNARFSGVKFSGNAGFDETEFSGDADFGETEFSPCAEFERAKFSGYAWFIGAKFSGGARFSGVKFSHDAGFGQADFSNYAEFGEAEFSGYAGFCDVAFSGNATFGQAVFRGYSDFVATKFENVADFHAIDGKSGFSLADATFSAVPVFIQAHFAEAPRFDDARIEPWRFRWPNTDDFMACFKGDSEASARWRALKRLAVQGHDHMREMEFFKREVITRRWVEDKPWHWVFWFGLLYGWLSDFGRSIPRPLIWWVFNVGLFWKLYLGIHLEHAQQPFTATGWAVDRMIQAFGGEPAPQLQCLAGLPGHPTEAAAWLSLRKALLLFGQGDGTKLDTLHTCLYKDIAQKAGGLFADLPNSVIGLGIAQHVISAILFFLLLLAIRNHFRIK